MVVVAASVVVVAASVVVVAASVVVVAASVVVVVASVVVVVVATGLASTAPTSQLGPCGRVTPRSSVAGGGQPAAASIAGLPGRSARVSRKVGPGGLYCSGPSSGSVFGRSPAIVGVHELPLSMLLPSDMMPPLQLAGVFAARMVFRSSTSTVPVPLLEVPPPPLAPFPATVLPSRRTKPSFQTPPPMPALVLFSTRVALVRVMTPSFQTPAPSPPAVPWLIVPFTRSSNPLFHSAAPSAVAPSASSATFMSEITDVL